MTSNEKKRENESRIELHLLNNCDYVLISNEQLTHTHKTSTFCIVNVRAAAFFCGGFLSNAILLCVHI